MSSYITELIPNSFIYVFTETVRLIPSFHVHILTSIAALIIIYLITKRKLNLDVKAMISKNVQEHVDECAYPNCVRCKRKTEIINRAKNKLKKYVKLFKNADIQPDMLKLIQSQLKTVKYKYSYEKQKPTIFYLPKLRARPFWDSVKDTGCEINTDFVYSTFKKEYEIISQITEGWKYNKTTKGSWRIFHLVDQGVVTDHANRFCPKTLKFLLKFKQSKFMQNTVFSNAAFSVLSPGTEIEAHYGPTNIRLRCHVGIEIPNYYNEYYCQLTVGYEKKDWFTNVINLFDDSFLHSATNTGEKDRVVLLYDIWHPDITVVNRDLLRNIFSVVD